MFPMIVADIGGTNARFALATAQVGKLFTIENVVILSGGDFDNFSDALAEYITTLGGVKPKAACIAIAGPIEGDVVKMTNLDWEFSQQQIQRDFAFEAFHVINDFAAVAIATSRLGDSDLTLIKNGVTNLEANKAIFGPGTGLGVAGLAYVDGSWLPIPSEGGHVNIAPATVFEADIIKSCILRHGHVSAEALISGQGFVNLYTAICDVEGKPMKAYEPHDITSQALSASDTLCVKTLETFCAFMGSFAGNLALTYGAKGGVYIAGGIVPRFTDFIKNSAFSPRFCEKGVMSHYVEDIPTYLISYDQVAFLGAAAWLTQKA